MPNYPSPCLKCTSSTCRENGNSYKTCAEYQTWFHWWWKWFRSHIPMLAAKPQVSRDNFCYVHPDEVRRYLEVGPCKNCQIAEGCNTVCLAYARWWDARMEILRKRVVKQ